MAVAVIFDTAELSAINLMARQMREFNEAYDKYAPKDNLGPRLKDGTPTLDSIILKCELALEPERKRKVAEGSTAWEHMTTKGPV